MSLHLNFTTLDVFTEKVFEGNQLAIVHVPHRQVLSQATKQNIAREFNLSETVFLHNAPNGREGVSRSIGGPSRTEHHEHEQSNASDDPLQYDIFTPWGELPFAGHPTIGTISYICSSTHPPTQSVYIKSKAGLVVGRYDASSGLAQAEIPHDVRVHASRVSSRDILDVQCFGPSTANSTSGNPLVSIVKGVSYLLVELADASDLKRVIASKQRASLEDLVFDDGWSPSFTALYYYVKAHERGSVEVFQTRMIEPNTGTEDAATGSAAGALASYVALQHGGASKTYTFEIQQGIEMGRASYLHLEVSLDVSGTAISKISLAGNAVVVSQGTLHVPYVDTHA